jgi:hypothetical protein
MSAASPKVQIDIRTSRMRIGSTLARNVANTQPAAAAPPPTSRSDQPVLRFQLRTETRSFDER